MNRSAEWCERRRRRAAKEIDIVSGSPDALMAMMMTSGEVKRLYRDRLDELTKLKKKLKRTEAQFQNPE